MTFKTSIGTSKLRMFLCIVALSSTAFSPATAEADSYQLITAGVGSAVGVTHVSGAGSASEASFTTDFNLRVKALYVLGLEVGYAPTDYGVGADGLNFAGALRLSALIYFVPTRTVSAYFKGGLEADDIASLFAIDEPSNAYHAGVGLDIELTDNWVLGVEYLMLVPGIDSVNSHLQQRIDAELPRVQAAIARGATVESLGIDQPEVSDFVHPKNFRLSVTARYYF